MTETTADAVIAALELEPHPEGGHFREVYRHAPADGGRGDCTSIYYLLRAGERSAWHRVRTADGRSEEVTVDAEELEEALVLAGEDSRPLVSANDLFMLADRSRNGTFTERIDRGANNDLRFETETIEPNVRKVECFF